MFVRQQWLSAMRTPRLFCRDATITLEGLSELGADHLLIMHTAGINQREQLEQTGIWGTLDPVRNDNVYWFDNKTYYDLSFGASGKLILLEQLEKQLLK